MGGKGRRETYGGGKGSECVREVWRADRVLVSWARRWRVCSRVLSSLSVRGGRGSVAIFRVTKFVGGVWLMEVECSRLRCPWEMAVCKLGGPYF